MQYLCGPGGGGGPVGSPVVVGSLGGRGCCQVVGLGIKVRDVVGMRVCGPGRFRHIKAFLMWFFSLCRCTFKVMEKNFES